MERQRDTSGRDVDRYRSERAGQHKRISYREMDGDQRRTDGRRRDISRDDSRSVTSDEEGANEKMRHKNKDKATDGSKYDIDRSGRRRDVRADEEDASDRRKVEFTKDRKIRGRSKDISSDDDDDSDRRNMKKREDRRKSDGHDLSDEDRETERTGIKPEEKSDEEDGEFRRSDRKGAHEVDSDLEDCEFRRSGRKGKHEDMNDKEGEFRMSGRKGKDEDMNDGEGEFRRIGKKGKHEDKSHGEIGKRERTGGSKRSDDEDDHKDSRRRGRNKDSSDEEDDKYKKKREDKRKRDFRRSGREGTHEVESDPEDSEFRRTGRKGKHEDMNDEEGEFRRSGRKGKHEDMNDEEAEFRRSGRKGNHEDKSHGEDGEIRIRERMGRSRRSDDEYDPKDSRRRGRYRDIKYKRRDRNRNRDRRNVDDSDDDGRRHNGKRYRRSNRDPKDKRRNDDVRKCWDDQYGDKENVDEGPRFQKLAQMQKGMTNLGKSGGVYIPPFKLARMMSEVQDKSSMEYQRMAWDALKKSINGFLNKVNATNIKNIIPELFGENLIRGRGLFCRSCMKSQMASPGFTDVFAALVAVVNTKFPEVGNLLLRRIILQLQRAYKRNDKHQLLAAVKFIAHLVNQQVVDELIALELLTTLLENPTDDSVEVAVGFITECGSILQDLSQKGLHAMFESFRRILHEGEIEKRVQYMIEGLFALRKANFQGHPAVRPELDLVESEDRITHEVSLFDKIDPEIALDIFKLDPDFIENDKRYELKKSLIDDESEAEEENGEDSDDDDDDESSEEEDEEQMRISDGTETNLVNLRRTIYLTIMSSVDFEEAGHKLLKIKFEPGQEMELCIMLLECCSQEKTYRRYYGLLGQRFCMISKVHQENFEKCFVQQYSMIHRLETNKLRNVATFFAHLLATDALPWHVLAYIRLSEEDTTSSSRIFIKILFQELAGHLGIRLLNERLIDPTMQADFESIFPRDNPKNIRFSINFFTSIGLGGITENLREYLKNMPRLIMQHKPASDSSSSDLSSSGENGNIRQ